MGKGPFKLKYTNGKTADAKTFPFKESPAKFLPPSESMKDSIASFKIKSGGIKQDRSHTHSQEYIIDPEQGDGSLGGGSGFAV